MDRGFRFILFALSIAQAILGPGFAFQIPFFTQLWPMPGTTPLSLIFIGSIFAAAAASTLWSLLAGENGSLTGIFLDYVVIFVPLAIFIFMVANGNQAIMMFGVTLVLSLLFGIAGLIWSLRFPIQDLRPQPMPVRITYLVQPSSLLAQRAF